MKRLVSNLLVGALCCPLLAATPSAYPPGKPLHLATGIAVDPLREPATALAGPAVAGSAVEGPGNAAGIVVVQFHGEVPARFDGWEMDPRRSALGFLPDDALIIRATGGQAASLAARPEVRWVGPMKPEWRVSPEVTAERARLRASAETPLNLELALWRGSRSSRVMGELQRLGAQNVRTRVADAGNTRVLFQLESGKLATLAALDEVAWIEPAPILTRRNTVSSWIAQSNSVNTYPAWNGGLHGEGEIIGHLDGEIDLNSCFFFDPNNGNIPGPAHRKIVAYFEPPDAESHGTHTAGTLAGKRYDGSLANAGIAYEARLAHGSDIEVEGFLDTPSTLKAAFLRAQDVGAWIHSNSWGDDYRTSYTFWCRDVDEYLWENEEAVVVFATTNLSTLRSPENAKNLIAVVASDAPPWQDYVKTGGIGPTYDGRRKPDVAALGVGVISARATFSCSTASATGTSMAAPAVAASAALVRQYFREGFYPTGAAKPSDGFIPSGPLIKAVLLNGTADMTGHFGFPSNLEGWGRLLLDRSLHFEGDTRTLLVGERRQPQGLSTGQVVVVPFVVDSADEMLIATLTWYDPPAAHAAATAWINDVNLELISPLGDEYLGNVFSDGVSVTGGSADFRNNVEQVRLTNPQPGEWMLRVVGEDIPMGPQGFAWAISGAVSASTVVPASPSDALWID